MEEDHTTRDQHTPQDEPFHQIGDAVSRRRFMELMPMAGLAAMGTAGIDRSNGPKIWPVDTMATLLETPTTQPVWVRAFYADSEGGGGLFWWDPNKDKQNHNGGTIIDPDHSSTPGTTAWYSSENTGMGCWKKSETGVIDIRTFGAVGDNTTVNTDSIQATLDYCVETGKKTYFPEGIFLTESLLLELTDNQNVSIIGEGRESIIRRAPDSIHSDFTRTFLIRPSATTDYVDIEGIYIDGNRRSQPDVVVAGQGSYEFQQCALIFVQQEFSNVSISNCWFEDPIADCIWVVKQNSLDIQNIMFVSRNATRSDILIRDVRHFYVNNIDTLEEGDRFSRIEIENPSKDPNVDVIKGTYKNCRIGQFEVGGPEATNDYLDITVGNLETINQFYANNGEFTVSNSDLRVTDSGVFQRRKLRNLILRMSNCNYAFPYDAENQSLYNLETVESVGAGYDLSFINVNFFIEDEGTLTFSNNFDYMIRLLGQEDEDIDNRAYFENCTFDERVPVCIDNFGRKLTTKNNNFTSSNYAIRVRSRTINNLQAIWHSDNDTAETGGLVTFNTGSAAAPIFARLSGGSSFDIGDINLESPVNFQNTANVLSSRKITGSDPTGTQGFEGDEVISISSGSVTRYVATRTHSGDANWVQS